MIMIGDVLHRLSELRSRSVDCVITSPPYYGLRDYEHDGQIGLESTPELYIAHLRMVFEQIYRVLSDTGTLWLNIGDSYNTYAGNRGKSKGMNKNHLDIQPRMGSGHGLSVKSLKVKDMIGIPWRLALGLQSDGWYLRQDIIWSKSNPMPESVKDRCTKSHEYLFLLTKSPRYHFDIDAIKEPAICGSKGSQFHTGKTGQHQLGRAQKVRPSAPKGSFNAKGEPLPGQLPFRAIREYRQKRSVWSISTKPFKGAHFATFPPDLVEPCLLAGCRLHGTVLDPFFGSGTVGVVAERHDRKWIGIEINQDYADMAQRRIDEARRKVADSAHRIVQNPKHPCRRPTPTESEPPPR